MDTESLRQALLELLQADTEKGKTWFFPSNVSDKYILFLGLTIKHGIQAVGVSIVTLMISILLFRSAHPLAVIFYAFSTLVSFGTVWGYHTFKPISDRKNISIADFMKERKLFLKKQKRLYRKPKERID